MNTVEVIGSHQNRDLQWRSKNQTQEGKIRALLRKEGDHGVVAEIENEKARATLIKQQKVGEILVQSPRVKVGVGVYNTRRLRTGTHT